MKINAPFAKVGGLGDVANALPPALKKIGVDIRMMIPLYGSIKRINKKKKLMAIECGGKKYKLKLIEKNVKINFNNATEKIDIYEAKMERVSVYFLKNDKFFGGRNVYAPASKFLFFTAAIIGSLDGINFLPEIIHCNDNHTGLIPVLLKIKEIGIKTILTIHNLQFQGQFAPNELRQLEISLDDNVVLKKDAQDGDVNKMIEGILLSDAVTTVSPTYAKEILTSEYGEGLDKVLKMRKDNIYGIINGINTQKFNPLKDKNIKYKFSAKNIKGKSKNKHYLLKNYFVNGFLEKDPVIGIVSRLAGQKGIDLVIEAMPDLFKKHPNVRLMILGTGKKKYEEELVLLAKRYPGNLKALIKFDIKIAQEIYAGSDIFLMPSKFEPCGLGQLIAMRYGTVPVVRKTGGLADTVNESKVESPKSKILKGNGFVFDKYSSGAMMKAIGRALECYDNKEVWEKIILNGMMRDSSWEKSAIEYLKLYKKIINS